MNFRQLMCFLIEQMKTRYLDYPISTDFDIKTIDLDTCMERYVIYFEQDNRRIITLVFEMYKKLDHYREKLIMYISNLIDFSFHTQSIDIEYSELQYFKKYPYDFLRKVDSLLSDFLAYRDTDNSNNELPKIYGMSRTQYKLLINSIYGITKGQSLEIEKVIFNEPATIVFWKNGCKTVVKCQDTETFDPEKGLAMAIAKYALGNEGNYYKTFTKYLSKEEKKE